MAFNINFFERWSDGVALGVNNMWAYTKTDETMATIVGAGYFNALITATDSTIKVNDIIWIQASDAQQFVTVTSIVAPVTVAPFSVVLGAGSVGTANIANLAVTTAKIDNLAVTTGKIADAAVTSAKLAADTIQYIQVAMTAAEWNGMSAAPFEILPAPGVGLIYQVDDVWYDMAFVAAQYAAGGVVNLQYDNTAVGAGVPVTADTAAATITGLAASSIVRPGLSTVAMAQLTTVNKGLFMSNKTAAFTTGDGTWKINVAYRIITA